MSDRVNWVEIVCRVRGLVTKWIGFVQVIKVIQGGIEAVNPPLWRADCRRAWVNLTGSDLFAPEGVSIGSVLQPPSYPRPPSSMQTVPIQQIASAPSL